MAEEIKQEQTQQRSEDRMVRLLSKDVEGKTAVYSGLTKVKGISWSMANAICKKLGMDKKRKVGSLTDEELKNLEDFMKNPELPEHLINRRKDFETGEDSHLIGANLELKKEFDIKRLKKIKSYRGFRHMSGLPSRGQRTRSNFRRNKAKGSGIKKKPKQ